MRSTVVSAFTKKAFSWLEGSMCMKATVNQHALANHEGCMISGQEIVFCWVPVP
jgi:hypothetical protein